MPPKEAAADERRVGRLIAPPVEVMGWCRLQDLVASDAVRVHSKQGAIVRHSGCSLAMHYAAASERLLDSSHGASIDGTCQWGGVVELVEITAIVILSVGVGLAGL